MEDDGPQALTFIVVSICVTVLIAMTLHYTLGGNVVPVSKEIPREIECPDGGPKVVMTAPGQVTCPSGLVYEVG